VAGLQRAFQSQQLVFLGPCQALANEKAFAAFLRTLFRQDWVVYAKAPFGGPEHVLQYLARYTHRVAISNHRLLSVDGNHVAFRWKDYAHHSKCRAMTLTAVEFLRRFLQHVLPKGLPRIRYISRRWIFWVTEGLSKANKRLKLVKVAAQFAFQLAEAPAFHVFAVRVN